MVVTEPTSFCEADCLCLSGGPRFAPGKSVPLSSPNRCTERGRCHGDDLSSRWMEGAAARDGIACALPAKDVAARARARAMKR